MDYKNTKHKIEKLWIDFSKINSNIDKSKFLDNKVEDKKESLNNFKYYNIKIRDYSFDWVNMIPIHDNEDLYYTWQLNFLNVKQSQLAGVKWNIVYDSEGDLSKYYSSNDYYLDYFISESEQILMEGLDGNDDIEDEGLKLYNVTYKIFSTLQRLEDLSKVRAKLIVNIENTLKIK